MGATTVEDITTTIATLILGDALTIGETIDPHHQRSLGIVLRERSRTVLRMCLIRIQVCRLITVGTTGNRLYLLELWQFGQLSEDLHQMGIVEDRRAGQQFTQVLDGRRNRLDEVFLLLEVTTETVSTQHLKGTEEHKQGEPAHEMTGWRHLYIILQRIIVFVDQFTAQLMRILRRSLPEERGKVVIVRSLTPALIVNKVRIAIVVKHHIAGLKVAIEETIHGRSFQISCREILIGRQILSKEPEICLKFQFVEVKLGGFQEAVLEIVQIEEHAVLIELRLRITVGEIQPTGTANLDVR